MFDIRGLLDILDTKILTEGSSIQHPEDLVITNSVTGANNALNSIIKAGKNPQSITMKWDGYPAIIFGRGPNGKFILVDKHMFAKKDGSGRKIYSPADFKKYDEQRGVDRGNLYSVIEKIWKPLEKATKGIDGFFWGDLLFSDVLQDTKGLYKFKANPNGITYTVDANSDLGKYIKDKIAGIAVHQTIPMNAIDLSNSVAVSDQTLENLGKQSQIAFLSSKLPIVPKIDLNKQLINDVKQNIAKYGKNVEKLLTTLPQARSSFDSLLTSYINKKIVSGNLNNLASDFLTYFESRPMSSSMKQKLSDHLNSNKDGVVGLFSIWASIYKLKQDLINQINTQFAQSPVQGYLDSGQQSQEGFISNNLKYIDRLGFSKQLLSARK